MKKLNFKYIAVSLVLILTCLNGTNAQTPTEVIKKANTKISDIQKNSKSAKQAEPVITKILEEYTSYSAIADNVKSAICPEVKPEKCKEFGEVFAELIKVSYTKKLANYRYNETEYSGEPINSNKAIVRTKVKIKDKTVKIDYELEKINKKWVIVNYIIDDVNTCENYKKQFKRMIKKDSIDSIIQNLKKKTEEFKSGKGE